jgi:hypothetical protein
MTRTTSILAVLLPTLGCASSTPTPATPPPASVRLPPADPAGTPSDPAPSVGVPVHIASSDPSAPLALYRVEMELSGRAYGRALHATGGGARGDGDLSSQLEDVHGIAFRVVCLAPCDEDVRGSPGQSFFLGGEGITSSSFFHLDPKLGRVTLRASPGSAARVTAGTVLVTVGSVGLFVSVRSPRGRGEPRLGAHGRGWRAARRRRGAGRRGHSAPGHRQDDVRFRSARPGMALLINVPRQHLRGVWGGSRAPPS